MENQVYKSAKSRPVEVRYLEIVQGKEGEEKLVGVKVRFADGDYKLLSPEEFDERFERDSE